jgi:uncharacterized protein YfiM (DUF2279 family)
MDGVLQLAALLVALGGPADPGMVDGPADRFAGAGLRTAHDNAPAPAPGFVTPLVVQLPADSWTGEDKFRHAAASWAAMVFTYAAARAVHDDSEAALAFALPVTASLGIAKEIVDQRRGGPFSFRDLAADALGAGAAWLFLREVR